jgi:uncharacterized protein (TIGR03437 family)
LSNLRSIFTVSLALSLPLALCAQVGSHVCNITAVPAVLHAEGVAERTGDIVFRCTGVPGRELAGNLSVSLNTAITNRILPDGTLDVVLAVNNTISSAPATLLAGNQVTFSGVRLPIAPDGTAEMRISNLRADASFGGAAASTQWFNTAPFNPGQQIVAQIAFNPGGLLNFTTTQFPVGVPQSGLFSTTAQSIVPSQFGSQLPESVTFPELIAARTIFSTSRVSEGYAAAFEPRQPGADFGTRIMLRFSGYPSDARLFVPAAIAGSDADVPTATGTFGGTPTGGRYLPGSNTLLLVRVLLTDSNGAGGFPASYDGGFSQMIEVPLTNGTGVAVFEVMDSSTQMQESAQIPVFIGLPRSQASRNVNLGLQTTFAPISTSASASAFAPIPRYANVPARSDCTQFRDCSSYLPKLGAPPISGDFRLIQGVGAQERVIPITNEGGGMMPWTATVEYKTGRDWIFLDTTSDLQARPIRMIVRALTELQPGKYDATVVVDAGPAGVARYPVTLEVILQPPQAPKPIVSSVVHGATFAEGPVARGSWITLKGENLAGANVSVAFDGKPAHVVYTNSTQINVQVPVDLAGNTAQVVVTVNGTASAPVMVNVAAVNPGIFPAGILNQDWSVNSPTNPANTGSYVQIYATGLLASDGSGVVEAKLGDQIIANPPYAGPAPELPGLQQVNLQIPDGWPTMTTEILLCTTAGGNRVCSPPANIHIRRAQ